MNNKTGASAVALAAFVVALGLALTAGCPRAPPAAAELWLGGDVHVGRGAGEGLAPLAHALTDALGVVNLEGPVGDSPEPGEGIRLVNAPGGVAGLRSAGVRVMGIANNHAGDRGPSGLFETATALREADVLPAGGSAGAAVFSAGGRRVAVTAHDLADGVPPNLSDELRAARARSDVLIATFHVTGPASYLPRPELRAAVDVALSAGARVVAAHGTHALGPVERRGDAVIAWGLGNLLFDCDCTEEIDGAVLRISLEGNVVRARIFPVDAGLRGAAARPGHDPALIFDLLEAIGSSPLSRRADSASF